MSFIGLGDIIKFSEIAATTYKYGFSKASRAPLLYSEFGNHVKGLATNLTDLNKIVASLPQNGRFVDSAYMAFLAGIIGDYERTVQDCEKFMTDKRRFSWQGDFISNIYWNFEIAAEVRILKDRVSSANVKLMTFLQTLDLKIVNQLRIDIFRIHQDLAIRIDASQERIINVIHQTREDIIEHLRSGNTAVPSSSRVSTNVFNIPASLETLLEKRLQGSSFDVETGQFPLVSGLDAVVYHINTANSIVADSHDCKQERQWLALAKAFWIMTKVKSGLQYKEACLYRPSNDFERQMNAWGITIASYVKRLEIELLEITKTSDINKITLEPGVLLQTFQSNPELCLPVETPAEASPTWELSYSENIMDASVRSPFHGFDQTIHLYRQTKFDLKLVIRDTPKPRSIGDRTNNIIPVDIRRSRFIPLYATTNDTSGTHGPLNITFQGDRLASGSSALTFNKRSELLKFQHAITGYQVVLESIGVEVVTYGAGRVMGGTRTPYTGRLQFWRYTRPQNNPSKGSPNTTNNSASSEEAGTSQSTVLAPITPSTTPSNSPPAPSSLFSRRDSNLSVAGGKFSFDNRRTSTVTTNSTTVGTTGPISLSPNAYTASVVSSTGTIGFILSKPEPSLLVLLLQPPLDTKQAPSSPSFTSLAISINENTTIDPSACKCRKDPSSCLRLVIQRSGGGTLTSFRQDATNLEEWNLAVLRKDQRMELGEAKERLAWVAVDFGSMEEKEAFERMLKRLRLLWIGEMKEYGRMLSRLRDKAD